MNSLFTKNSFLISTVNIFAIFAVFFAFFSVANATIGPSVKLRGDNFIAVSINSVFIDPGAYVADADGNWNFANVTVSGDFDIHKVGYYTLTYSGFDTEGNVATPATRTVFVYENTNTAPVIELIGSNPITINLGGSFVDPGATATDAEDGPITEKITTSGSVDVNQVGSYLIIYSVSDSRGLVSSVSRNVNVISAPSQCSLSQTIAGQTVSGVVGQVFDYSIQMSTNTSYISVQNNTLPQGLSSNGNRITGTPTVVGQYNVAYRATNSCGFSDASLLINISSSPVTPPAYNPTFTLVNTKNNQSIISSSMYVSESWRFTIVGAHPNSVITIATSQTKPDGTTGPGTGIRTLGITNSQGTLTITDTTGVIDIGHWIETVYDGGIKVQNQFSFDVLPLPVNPPTNTPPVITLIGANPATTTVGSTFTDPGATATDAEDGDITNKIIASSTVNTNIAGTYQILYSVTDNGGLTATTTRTVVVIKNGLYCAVTDPTQNGWHATYFNYSSTTLGMELPTSDWSKSYGDPLSNKSQWTANWYSGEFSRFSRVDSNIRFGSNFFPFDSAPEELINGHDYHFGVHWSAKVNATTTGQYSFVLTSDDDAWIYVDGELVADNSGVHSPKTLNSFVYLTSGDHIIDIYFAERHTTQSSFSFEFSNKSLNIKPYSPLCKPNTPPVITLIGANPATTTVGSTFTDPGATATDAEDGDITNKIIASSTVNTNIAGTYQILYSVTDNGGLTATTTRTVVVSQAPVPTPSCTFDIYSNPKTLLEGGVPSVATYDENPAWTANIPGATWIWKTFFVEKPTENETVKFTRSFVINDNVKDAMLVVAADNTYSVEVNGTLLSTTYDTSNYFDENKDTYNVSSYLKIGLNTISFTVTNLGMTNGTAEINPAGLLYKLSVTQNGTNCDSDIKNTPPVITLIGANPATTTVGSTFTDPGATATDAEDGDITNKIIASSTVNTNIAGTYQILYSVTDNGGLTATTTRTVVVESTTPVTKGKVNFCLILANSNNVIATTSADLPTGTFSISLATSTNVSSTTIFSKTWNNSSFAPNAKTILNTNDSDCVSVDNLSIDTYYYPELSQTGSLWNLAKYNDQDSQPVNNVFDFFSYSTSTNNNSDGLITLDSSRKERTLVMYVTYNTPTTTPVNTPPVITLIGANPATTTVGSTFTDPGATATDAEDGDITNKIIASSTVNTNIAGTYQILYSVTDNGGLTATTTRTVVVETGSVPPPQCLLPEITSSLTASVTVNQSFSYTLTASSTATTTLSVATSTLPVGLSYDNGVISGVPTQVGTYSITLNAENSCGLVSKTLVLTVSSGTTGSGCTYNCGGGGGGGGGGNGPIVQSLTIFNESVIETEPGVAMVTWNTNLSTDRKVVYGNQSVTTLGSADSNYGYSKTTELVSNPLLTAHGMVISIEAGKTYYFRPVSSDGKNTVVGKELTITKGVTGGGTITTTSNSCYYLYDYLRRDLQNNPVEVKKLQVFLNSFEGANLTVNGIYDEATEKAVDVFQNKYKGDILTPWGHTEPTGYTYILTKKKVNEIYCQKAFPVTVQQQEEIDSFRAFLESLSGAGVTLPPAGGDAPEAPKNLENTIIGQNTVEEKQNGGSTGTQTTLAGVSTTTKGIMANVISSGREMGNLALAFLAWPFSLIPPVSSIGNICTSTNWMMWVLILAIIVISIMWYGEYRNNRNIEKINKEIDLTK